jgi:hypothetical protein
MAFLLRQVRDGGSTVPVTGWNHAAIRPRFQAIAVRGAGSSSPDTLSTRDDAWGFCRGRLRSDWSKVMNFDEYDVAAHARCCLAMRRTHGTS